MAMSHSLIYRVCRGGDQCQTVRPGRRTARIKTRSRVSLQKSHTQDILPGDGMAVRWLIIGDSEGRAAGDGQIVRKRGVRDRAVIRRLAVGGGQRRKKRHVL